MSVEFDYAAAGISLPIKGTQRSIEFIDKAARNFNIAGVHFLGVTETPLSEGSYETEILINGETHTVRNGDIVVWISKEFIFSEASGTWRDFGGADGLGDLSFVSHASTSYTPEGTIVPPEIVLNTNPDAYIVDSASDVGEVIAGSPDSFPLTVDENGVLDLSFTPNTPTVVTLPQFTRQTIIAGIESVVSASFEGTEANLEVN